MEKILVSIIIVIINVLILGLLCKLGVWLIDLIVRMVKAPFRAHQ